MADNHSFDVVSEINHAEMHNAVVQAQHEMAVRFDFKGTQASIEFNKKDNALTILADHKGQLETVLQILKEKMARRGVPGQCSEPGQDRGRHARHRPREPDPAHRHRCPTTPAR